MGRIMGYADRWSVAPGDTIRFMVSALDGGDYEARVVRLKQPDAGPLATPFAPEPVDAPCNGTYPGRRQSIPIGSLSVVANHPVLSGTPGVTLIAYVWPTTPGRGRQAIMGTWCEATHTGYGMELDEAGGLELRVGTDAGVASLATGVSLLAERWYAVAATIDTVSGALTLSQAPVPGNGFHAERAVTVSGQATPGGFEIRGPLTLGAWQAGPADGPSCWGGLAFTRHFNGRIDRPRLAGRALEPAEAATLAAGGALPDASDVLGAWDFSRGISGDTIFDTGPNRLHGAIVNQPTRAMRGHNWTGEYSDWRQAPDQYGAIHFHDDDLVDARWDSDFAYTIPVGLRSGVYAVRLDCGGFDYWMPFFVRPPRGTATSKVAFLASTATYTVYLNNRGRFMSLATERAQGRLMFMDAIDELLVTDTTMGLSTYDRHSDGSGVAYASRHRPLQNFRPTGRHWNFNLDLFIIDWLEHLGGDYDVITEEDLHREGLDLLRPYQVVLTGSHPEYDSVEMLDAMQAYLRQGGRLMYMGGNGFYWRIAHHRTRDGVIEVRRAEGGVRAWNALPGEFHFSFSGEYGGLWRNNGRAPQCLAGVGFISQGFDHCSYYRRTPEAADKRIAWAFVGVDEDLIGDFGLLQGGAAGLEIDSADQRLGTPPHALVIGRSENHSNTYEVVPEEVLIPHGATDALLNPDIHADMVFFETPRGGAVWSTGSIAFAGSLGWNRFDNNVCRIATNVLRRFTDQAPFQMPK
jgi:N,N-dimethylformamidase